MSNFNFLSAVKTSKGSRSSRVWNFYAVSVRACCSNCEQFCNMRSQRVLEWNCFCLVIWGKGQSSLRKGCSVFILMVTVLVLAVWKSILGSVIRPWVGRISVRSVGLSFLRVNWNEEKSHVERFHTVYSWDLVFLKTMVSKNVCKKERVY